MYFGTKVAFKSVIAARLTALLAWAAAHHGDRVGGVLFGGDQITEIQPKARTKGVLPLLQCLAQFSAADPTKHSCSLSKALLHCRRVIKPHSLVFILSDFYCLDSASETLLNKIRQQSTICGFYIRDCTEITAPPPGLYPVSDGDQDYLLDTRKDKNTARYVKHFEHLYHSIEQVFNHALYTVETDSNLLQLLRTITANAFPMRACA